MHPHLTHHRVPLSPESPESLSCALFRPATPTPSTPLLIFINGLLTKSPDWNPTLTTLTTLPSPPFLLTYDRFNVPPSDPLPPTRTKNDISTAAHDLNALLASPLLNLPASAPLVLIGSSIGCCIIRLFAEYYPAHNIAGVLFLDSYISNTDFTSLFPAESEGEPEALTRTRAIITHRFHPAVGNAEHLDRSTAQDLLPSAEAPGFRGELVVVVVGHDPEYNVEDMVQRLDIDKDCYLRYVQSAWDEYNAGLVKLSAKGRYVGAERSGHFVYHDRPDLVVREIEAILEAIS